MLKTSPCASAKARGGERYDMSSPSWLPGPACVTPRRRPGSGERLDARRGGGNTTGRSTGAACKGMRQPLWAIRGRGKRGGARVIYYHLISLDQFYMLLIYGKNEQDDLSPEQLRMLKKAVEAVWQ